MADDCRQVRRDLQVFLDGECETVVERVITTHLRDCPGCEDRVDFERHLRVRVARCCRESAPVGLLDRVVRGFGSA